MAAHVKPLKEGVLTCLMCGNEKSLEEFSVQTARTGNHGRDPRCKACVKAYKALPENQARRRITERRRKFRKMGVTEEEVIASFWQHGSCCAACRKPLILWASNMAVDHDHKTGKFRGVLCSSCNTTLGIFNEDVDLLMALVAYKLSFSNVMDNSDTLNLAELANATIKDVV